MGNRRATSAAVADFSERRPSAGRNREALTGIVFVLKTGIPWEDLPQEMGFGCEMTCWRRMVAWQEAGIWDELHHVLLAMLHGADRIDWSGAIVDIASLKAVLGWQKPARIPRIVASVAASIA